MKRFITRLSIACVIMVPLAFLPMTISLWISERNLQHAFDLAPHEEVLFFGDSVTGCSITEYPNDDYRVLWRSSTPQIFALAMLKELERQGKLKNIKVCAIGIGYHSAGGYRTSELRRHNISLFGLTWKYSDLFPVDVFYSPAYLFGNRYLLGGNPLSEIPPAHGISFNEQPSEKQEQILAVAKSYKTLYGTYHYHENMARMTSTFLAIQDLCRRNDIMFLVFFTPHLSRLNDIVPATIKADYLTLLKTLEQHGAYTFDCRTIMPDEYFRDGIHLLPEGSKIFTEFFFSLIIPFRTE